jgi:hypothetical protein
MGLAFQPELCPTKLPLPCSPPPPPGLSKSMSLPLLGLDNPGFPPSPVRPLRACYPQDCPPSGSATHGPPPGLNTPGFCPLPDLLPTRLAIPSALPSTPFPCMLAPWSLAPCACCPWGFAHQAWFHGLDPTWACPPKIRFSCICLSHLSSKIMLLSISGPTNYTFCHIRTQEWLIAFLLNL